MKMLCTRKYDTYAGTDVVACEEVTEHVKYGFVTRKRKKVQSGRCKVCGKMNIAPV